MRQIQTTYLMILECQISLESKKSYLACPNTKICSYRVCCPLHIPRRTTTHDGSETSTIAYGDAAYGSRATIAACGMVGVVSGILYINVVSRNKGFVYAWGTSYKIQARRQYRGYTARPVKSGGKKRESGVLEGQR